MPTVIVHMLEGRSNEQLKKLVASVTAAVCESIGVASEKVTIIVDEKSPSCYAQGGKLLSDINHNSDR